MKKRGKIILTVISLSVLLIAAAGFIYFYIINQPRQNGHEGPDIIPGSEVVVNEEVVYEDELTSTPQDHTLVKIRGGSQILWLQNNKLYPVKEQMIIDFMNDVPGWDDIHEFSAKKLEGFQNGPEFISAEKESNGLIIQMKNTDYIFLVNNGKREYLNREDFQRRNLSESDIIVTSPRAIKLVPPTPPTDHLSLQESVKAGKIEVIGSGKYFEEGVVFTAGPYDKNTAVNIERGDVLLSKTGKQSLVVTQSFEVFIPAGQKIKKEGLWVACIDRYRNWPLSGEKLDVTLNLKDWKLAGAEELSNLIRIIDLKGLNKNNSAQKAIWKITDEEKPDEEATKLLEEADIDPDQEIGFIHLSNHNSSPKTSFVKPPELSILGLAATSVTDCPEGTKATDKIICQDEAKLAMKSYLEQKYFPGTTDQLVDAKIISLIMSFYILKKPIDETIAQPTQDKIYKAALDLIQLMIETENFKTPSFYVKGVKTTPEYIANQESLVFDVLGQGVKDMRIKVFDRADKEVFDSGLVFGNSFEWHLRDGKGNLLPNEFYYYTVETNGFKENSQFTTNKRQIIIKLEQN